MKHTSTGLAAFTALAVLAILSLPLIGRAEDDATDLVDLSLRLQPGDTYALTMTTDKTINEWIQNNETISTSTATFWLTMNVIAVDEDGTAEVKLTFDRVAVKTNAEDKVSEYDSQNPGENLKHPLTLYQALIGQSFTVKLSPAGEVLKVLDTNALHGAQIDALSRGKSMIVIRSTSKAGLTSAVFGLELGLDPTPMDKDSLKRLAASLVSPRPGEPVATGHTWEREKDLPVDPAMTCASTYKLDSREDGVATIDIEGVVEHDPHSRAGKPVITFTGMTSSMAGTRSGVLKLDEASGLVTAARIVDTVKAEMKPNEEAERDDDEQAGVPISILTSVDIVTTIECKKQAQAVAE